MEVRKPWTKEDFWEVMIGLLELGIVVFLWWLSMFWSASGFAFSANNAAFAIAIGWGLGFCVTGMELIFNEKGFAHNPTIILISFLCYAYGMLTNIAGFWIFQGMPDPTKEPFKILMAILIGVAIEITPEPLLALFMKGDNYRDVLSHLFGNSTGQGARQGGQQQRSNNSEGESRLREQQARLDEAFRQLSSERRRFESQKRGGSGGEGGGLQGNGGGGPPHRQQETQRANYSPPQRGNGREFKVIGDDGNEQPE